MTTTLSMPQSLYKKTDKTAKTMGVSQKKLIVLAVQKYIEVYENANTQNDFDEAYSNYIPDRKILNSGVARVRELLKNDAW
jgi:metal-responsive CopG/Arc/MetJ family transcriptional regulator